MPVANRKANARRFGVSRRSPNGSPDLATPFIATAKSPGVERVRWWQRVRALVVLALIVTSLGVLVAVLVVIAFIGGTILLETVS